MILLISFFTLRKAFTGGMAEAGSVSFEDQSGLEREFQDCWSYTLKPWDGRGVRGKKQNNSCCVVKAGLWQVPGVPECRLAGYKGDGGSQGT